MRKKSVHPLRLEEEEITSQQSCFKEQIAQVRKIIFCYQSGWTHTATAAAATAWWLQSLSGLAGES
jgi:hypothetical protein